MIKRAIVDSGIFIGSNRKEDQWHSASVSILNAFKSFKIKEVHITDYVLLETINFLIRKSNYETALKAYEYMLKTEGMNIHYVDNFTFSRIEEIFKKYKDLSLTDCSLIALADSLKIRHLFSFDKLFDKVKSIERLENYPTEEN